MTSDDNWFAGFDDDLTPMEVEHTPPKVPMPRATADRHPTPRAVGYVAALLVFASFFVDWYRADVADLHIALKATSPWLLGFFALTWAITTAMASSLLDRKLSAIGAVLLVILGLIDLFQVAVFVTFKSAMGWGAHLVNSIANSSNVDTGMGLGSYMHLVAGLMAITAGIWSLKLSTQSFVRRHV